MLVSRSPYVSSLKIIVVDVTAFNLLHRCRRHDIVALTRLDDT